MTIRAVLFDLDGILVDFADYHFQALNQALQEVCGRPVLPEDRGLYEGLSTRQKLVMMIDNGRIAAGTEHAIYRLKQEHTARLAAEQVKPDPSKTIMCRSLSGYKLGCVSNCVRDSVDALLHGAGLMKWMQVTISNEDVINPKPEPDPYVLACQRLGISPAEAMAVEDHERGVISAEAAGCHVLQIDDYKKVTVFRVQDTVDELNRKARCRS